MTANMEPGEVCKLAPDLWVVARPFRLPVVRAEVGTRMTIVRLADGGLFLHSPIQLDQGLQLAIDRLGEVRAIVRIPVPIFMPS